MKYLFSGALLLVLCNPALAQIASPLPATAEPASAPAAGATDISAPPSETTAEPDAPGPRIYLVTRVKMTGTDLTQVVFFQHPAMSNMETCEAERAAGLMNNWNYFGRYYLTTLKGVAYKIDYRCVEGSQRLSYWRRGNGNNTSYLVRTGDNKLQVSSHANFFECRDALRAVAREEGIDNFCAVSSQTVMADPPPQG